MTISNPAPDGQGKIEVTLDANDFQFIDDQGNALTTPVINAGTYRVGLTKAGIAKVKAEVEAANKENNYHYNVDYDKANTANFVVEKAKVTATVSGEGKKDAYDGTPVKDFKPSVTFKAPGVEATTVDLVAGVDYVWRLNDKVFKTAPSNAGNYIVELTATGKSKITSLNADNVAWTITGNASYVINKAKMPVTFKPGEHQPQPGQSVSSSSDFDPINNFNPQALVDGSSTTSVVLQRVKGNPYGYYAFIDKDGKQIDGLPTADGSYKVILTEAGMAKVRELFAGKVNFNNYEMVNKAFGYLNVGTTSAMIHYVDADDNDKPVDVQLIAGEANTRLEFTGDNSLKIPAGYKPAPNQPTGVKLGAFGSNTDVTIKLVHKTVTVQPNDPKTPEDQLPDTPGKDYPAGTNYPTGVAKDDLNKTITRTIIQKLPSGEEKTTTQTVTFTRTATVDLVTGEITYGDWTSTNATWEAKDVSKPGYTVLVDGNEVADGKVPAATVNSGAENVTVKVTYTATATATLNGSASSTYTGLPITITDVNSKDNDNDITVTVTGPDQSTSGKYTLVDGDIEFSNDNGKTWTSYPTVAGTYKIQLTAQGISNIKNKFGNSSITWGENDANITSNATYTIKKAPASAALGGNGTTTYDGSAVSDSDIKQAPNNLTVTVTVPGVKETQSFTDLTADDFDWFKADEQGNKTGAALSAIPTNAGNYVLELNAKGQQAIIDQFGNDNVVWTKDNASTITGSAKFSITQADGTVSIKNTTENNYSKSYDGQPTTSVDMSKLTVTAADGKTAVIDFSTSGLTNAGFIFTDAEGNVLANQPTAAGTYYIKLTADGLAKLNTANPNYKLTYDNSLATYQITQADLTVKQGGSSNHAYTGSPLSPELSDVLANLKATAGLVKGESLNTTGLTLADFDWTAKKDAGDYTLELNQTGLKTLQDNNKNYSISAVTGAYTFTINKANGTAVFGGSGTKTYNGSAIDYKPTITVTAPGTATTVDLTTGTDYVWYLLDANGDKTGAAITTAPVNAGNYSVELTTAGKDKITALNAANIDWTGENAITGTGSYVINKATATVNFTNGSGQTVDYSGQTGKFDASKFTPSITTNNGQTLIIPEGVHLSLADGDFTINGVKTTTEPVALGTYTIGLSDTGFAKLQSATNNYNWENQAKASYVIKANDKATVTVTNNVADGGHQTVVYKGSSFSATDINLGDYALTLPTGLTYQLQAGDLELVGDPINVGTYTVQLSAAGKTNLQTAAGDNFKFDFDKAGVANTTANFEITKATPNVTFNGVGSKTFGQDDTKWTTPAGLTFTDAPGMGNQTISLANGDYEFVGQDGTVYQSVPTNAGTYKV